MPIHIFQKRVIASDDPQFTHQAPNESMDGIDADTAFFKLSRHTEKRHCAPHICDQCLVIGEYKRAHAAIIIGAVCHLKQDNGLADTAPASNNDLSFTKIVKPSFWKRGFHNAIHSPAINGRWFKCFQNMGVWRQDRIEFFVWSETDRHKAVSREGLPPLTLSS